MIYADSFLQRNAVPIDAIVVLVGIAITLLVTWVWRLRDRQSKHLDYRVVSDIPIIASHKAPEKLKIVYRSLEVKDPRVTELRFKNTGKQVIDTADFLEKPYQILPRPGAAVLRVQRTAPSHTWSRPRITSPADPKETEAKRRAHEASPSIAPSSQEHPREPVRVRAAEVVDHRRRPPPGNRPGRRWRPAVANAVNRRRVRLMAGSKLSTMRRS